MLQLVMFYVLQKEGATITDTMGWQILITTVPSQPHQKPKIQHHYIPSPTALQSVQILPQFIFPYYGL